MPEISTNVDRVMLGCFVKAENGEECVQAFSPLFKDGQGENRVETRAPLGLSMLPVQKFVD